MPVEIVERYQVAGVDERERGFSRLTDVERVNGGVCAVLRYEATMLKTRECGTTVEALVELVRLLRERGYTQLKSRLNFRGSAYLGGQEPWIEYPDPEQPSCEAASMGVTGQRGRRSGWIGWVLKLLGG